MMFCQNNQLLAQISLKCHSAQVSNVGNISCDNYIPELDLQKHDYFIHRSG